MGSAYRTLSVASALSCGSVQNIERSQEAFEALDGKRDLGVHVNGVAVEKLTTRSTEGP